MSADEVGQAAAAEAAAPTYDSPVDLHRARYDVMVRLAALLTGSQATAEEVVQDAFVKLIERWDRVEHPSAYLRASVVNGCTGFRRHREVVRRHATPPVLSVVDTEGYVLREAIHRLPTRQRAVLVLRFYEDLPEAEIAALLSCRLGTVKSALHRGLAQLRRVVEP
jgi:RNA polymerase sigma-70 factor (sigma-E family)